MMAHYKTIYIRGRLQFPDILRQIGAKKLVEIGVADGAHLRNLCRCDPEVMIAVDVWDRPRGDSYMRQRTGIHNAYFPVVKFAIENPCVVPIKLKSYIAAECFEDGYFDFIYIDANHHYTHVLKDIKCWWPKLRNDGIIAGHDYNLEDFDGWESMGVKRAVIEFAEKECLEVTIVEEEIGTDSWAIVKGNSYRLESWKRPDVPILVPFEIG